VRIVVVHAASFLVGKARERGVDPVEELPGITAQQPP